MSSNRTAMPPTAWGIQSVLYFQAALCIQAGIVACGWRVIGEQFDSPKAFLIWLGLAPLILIPTAVFWDSYARKILAFLGVAVSSLIGFMAGMAWFENELFQNAVEHGAYADDFAVYLGLVIGASLLATALGMWIHFLLGRSRYHRDMQGADTPSNPLGAAESSHREWNRHLENPAEEEP